MGSPNRDRCFCRVGYKCPICEKQEKREAKYQAEKRRVEKLLDGGSDQ